MMRLLLLILLLIAISFSSKGQKYKDTILRYDYSTYKGTPVKTGWLFSDSTYRRFYKSYNAADTMSLYLEQQMKQLGITISDMKAAEIEYKKKADDDSKMIADQKITINTLTTDVNKSLENNQKLLNQFWVIGNQRIHKGTTLKVGISVGVLAYLIGRAH